MTMASGDGPTTGDFITAARRSRDLVDGFDTPDVGDLSVDLGAFGSLLGYYGHAFAPLAATPETASVAAALDARWAEIVAGLGETLDVYRSADETLGPLSADVYATIAELREAGLL